MARILTEAWGKVGDAAVQLITLRNRNGLVAQITNYGATIVSLKTPDNRGQLGEVCLGYDDLNGYLNDNCYFGCAVGRYANRITKGKFSLDGKDYQLATNNGPNHLHGGPTGFSRRVWEWATIERPNKVGVSLTYESKDGEEGFPGNLSLKVEYTLNDNDELVMDIDATTDKATVINICNHAYWNLGSSPDVFKHSLFLNSSFYTPVDDTMMPTGEVAPVVGTPLDFYTSGQPIGLRVKGAFAAIEATGGAYDHNFVVNRGGGDNKALALVATVDEPTSGRVMEVRSTQPGVQLYTGNWIDNVKGHGGKVYGKFGGFCLETQNFPDAPNRGHFPSAVLRPNERYQHQTVYAFSVRRSRL